MSEALIQKVRKLLEPTFDEQAWYRDVIALDKSEAVPILAGIVRRESESLRARQQAILILGLMGDESAIELLLDMLSAPEAGLRAHSAQSLGRFKSLSGGGFERLLTALKDDDHFVRERAAKALAQLQRPEALTALQQMRASDPVASNREMAAEAMKTIAGTE